MTTLFSTIKSASRAAIIIVALAGSALSAAPAMAESGPSMSFSLQLPGGNEMNAQRQYSDDDWDDDYGFRCLTSREVRQGLGEYGFRRVTIVRELSRDRVDVRAQYGNWIYGMRVDKCSGAVSRVQRLGRGVFFNGGNNGGGFGFEFSFGN